MENLFIKDFKLYPHEYFKFSQYEGIIDSRVIDLFNAFCSIYYTDIMIRHTVKTEDDGREMELVIPVINLELFNNNKHIIEKLAYFMSRDKWNISFIKATFSRVQTKFSNQKTDNNYSSVTLISGGLDSFCGAYYNKERKINTIYCGYKLNNHEQHYQQKILDFISREQNLKQSELKLFDKIKALKKEYTQRTRSLLFLSLACVVANMYNIDTISLYENGVLSLNPDLFSRKTTKTTHPRTIFLFNKILENLSLDIRIEHPFLFKTKGEIIKDLPNIYKQVIKDTYTCSTSWVNPKYKTRKHCGVCIPCTLRKISLAAYDLEKYDREYEVDYGEKIVDIREELRGDFKSSNEYFKTFKEKIDSGSIFSFLDDIRQKYYSNSNFLEYTKSMLSKFSLEVEKYYEKYPI